MRGLVDLRVMVVTLVFCGVAAPLTAQPADERETPAVPRIDFTQVITQPAGPPPTPRHTGIKAMLTGLVTDVEHLPSRENLMWVGIGGGLALAVHPFDKRVNRELAGNTRAENFFKAGEAIGELGTLLGSASAVYAVGRLKDQPQLPHVGMDLIQSPPPAPRLTQTLKY